MELPHCIPSASTSKESMSSTDNKVTPAAATAAQGSAGNTPQARPILPQSRNAVPSRPIQGAVPVALHSAGQRSRYPYLGSSASASPAMAASPVTGNAIGFDNNAALTGDLSGTPSLGSSFTGTLPPGFQPPPNTPMPSGGLSSLGLTPSGGASLGSSLNTNERIGVVAPPNSLMLPVAGPPPIAEFNQLYLANNQGVGMGINTDILSALQSTTKTSAAAPSVIPIANKSREQEAAKKELQSNTGLSFGPNPGLAAMRSTLINTNRKDPAMLLSQQLQKELGNPASGLDLMSPGLSDSIAEDDDEDSHQHAHTEAKSAATAGGKKNNQLDDSEVPTDGVQSRDASDFF
ncbi:hypothetical protein GQ42DRAFT_156606 [Ramicandelaber brevisporus]|nr:hypothetical protein GQ42DRAFT_156606 [Ramicandelaber brevisporus]